MESGDRVLVFHSPGSPLDHYVYARVMAPQAAGALVKIEHPANINDGEIRFVPAEKIRTKADLPALADAARKNASTTRDSTRQQEFLRIAQNYDFQASQL